MCGDPCCPSCGPLQGNWKCILCGAWATEECEHVNEEGNGYKPEFADKAEAIAESQAEALYEEYLEQQDYGFDYPWEIDKDGK